MQWSVLWNPFKKHLPLKFDVYNPAKTEDINIPKLVILVTSSYSKMMVKLLILGSSRINATKLPWGRFNLMVILLILGRLK